MRASLVSTRVADFFGLDRKPTQVFEAMLRSINALIARTGGVSGAAFGPLPAYTVATAPDAAANARMLIYVSDEAGGATVAFSDGVAWRRTQDRAIIS